MDIGKYNSEAWDRAVANGDRWTIPISHEEFVAAQQGCYEIYLTPTKPVPKKWVGKVRGKRVLCLASGGGQQSAVFAALEGIVTVVDASQKQLEQDDFVCERENIGMDLRCGDMRDLSEFADETFDLIFHPVSNCFVEDIEKVWQECYRVLKKGGVLLAGFANPVLYLFNLTEWNNGNLVVTNSIPYADLEQLSKEELETQLEVGRPLEFGHSLQDQIGGQLNAGFLIAGMYEDTAGGDLLDEIIPTFMATKAYKL